MNYTYYNNFYHLKDFVKDINNEYLIKFNDNPDFKNQSLNLIDLFSFYYPKKSSFKLLKSNIKEYYSLKDPIPEKINNQYYFDNSNKISIAKYDKKKILFMPVGN